MGRNRLRPYKRNSVLAAEAIAHAQAIVAAQRGVADRVLIFLVEEVGDAAVEGEAAGEGVAGREVEAGIAGIAGDAEPQEVAVGAPARKVASEIEIEAAIAGAEPEVAGVDRAAKEMIAGLLDGRSAEDRLEHARIVEGVVGLHREPVI